jgi:hypothetical protein
MEGLKIRRKDKEGFCCFFPHLRGKDQFVEHVHLCSRTRKNKNLTSISIVPPPPRPSNSTVTS